MTNNHGQYGQHINIQCFQKDILTWYAQFKRDLPWRKTSNPYHILISETMLQQTQVSTVIPYFQRFVAQFPTPEVLANASEEVLLKAWEGLGYYSRARNLQASARMITKLGHFPTNYKDILSLKGVGPYTAGAVASIAFSLPVPAVDGNVFRVIGRIACIYEDITKIKTRKLFEEVVAQLISHAHPGEFNQGLMELGATICKPTSPKCPDCPVKKHCKAQEDKVVEQLPVKTKPAKQVHVKWAVALIENTQGEFLIAKRPSTELLANFYVFKQIEYANEKAVATMLTEHLMCEGYQVQQIYALGSFKHVFTHRIWSMAAFHVKVNAAPQAQPNEQWVARDSLKDYSLAAAHLKILNVIDSAHL